MLSRLSIKNYAIIHQLDIEFSDRLNAITGETGAGKSIIVGALGLILGQRAESSVLMNKEKKCIVEGFFKDENKDNRIAHFLQEAELDNNDELVVRREIAPNGKSRAFINDTPVNLSQLNNLSSLLVDLHQQFDTLELGEANFQREVLDALAGNFSAIKQYQDIFLKTQVVKKSWDELVHQKTLFVKEFDYNNFQFTELEEAGFKEGELEQIEQELKLLSNAEAIKNALTKAYYELEEIDQPIIRQLKSISSQLQNFSDVHSQLPELLKRLQSATIELQDIAGEIDGINNQIGADVSSIDLLNERLSLGYRLLKKHGVKTTDELIEIKNSLHKKLQEVLHIDDAINKLEAEYKTLVDQATGLAAKISTSRKTQIKPLEDLVNKMLAQVGMPNARLKVEIKTSVLNNYGSDDVSFLFDANLPAGAAAKDHHFQPLHKVASGGELSRLMLCIKSLVATSMNLPTLIFDEIDTGISGEAAKQVGMIMKTLCKARQVICITHQPQIAGKADTHFMVYKDVKNDAVTTGIRLLNKDERIVAIAKMLSGERPTAAALENAREMVMN